MLHHAARWHVLRFVDAHDALEPGRAEAEFECRRAGLGGQTPAAEGSGQAPAHLDRGQDLGQEMRNRETRPPDEPAALTLDDGLDAKAVALVAPDHAVDKPLGVRRRHGTAERVPPEGRVGVDRHQVVEVATFEGPEHEALGGERGDAGVGHRVGSALIARRS